MIKFNHVSKIYFGSKPALQNITFSIQQGEMAYLTGHSGAGKSTLLRLLCGFESANDGKITINGIAVNRLKRNDLPFLRRSIGMVFQNYQLLSDHTVYENVALPLVILGKNRDEIRRRVYAALDRVGLNNKQHFYPLQLSGGEQQRISIARAIVNKPFIILADEPTGNLDDTLSQDIFNLFEMLNKEGITILMTTHNLRLIKPEYRVLNLAQGRLVRDDYGVC